MRNDQGTDTQEPRVAEGSSLTRRYRLAIFKFQGMQRKTRDLS